MNRLAVIVLNWNGADDSIECIDSLRTQTYKKLEIILIDNNSSDDSVEVFKQYMQNNNVKNITLIENDVNSGFAGGINVGFKYALDKKYAYVAILNPDAIADKQWAHELVNVLEGYTDVGIATGILLRRDGKTIDSTGDWVSKWGLAFPRNRDDVREKAPNKGEYVFGATGGSVICRTEMIEKIGGMDEDFFMYYEDVDISFRAQLAGYKVYYTPKALAYHKQGASTDKVPGLAVYNTFKNLPQLVLKNTPSSLMWTVLPRFKLAYTLILLNAIVKGRGWPALKGWLKSITLMPATIKKRQAIQKNRVVSDEYLRDMLWDDLPPEQTGLRKFRSLFTGKQ